MEVKRENPIVKKKLWFYCGRIALLTFHLKYFACFFRKQSNNENKKNNFKLLIRVIAGKLGFASFFVKLGL